MDKSTGNNESAPFKLPEVKSEPKDAVSAFESENANKDEHSMSRAIEQNQPSSGVASITLPSTPPVSVDPSVIDNQYASNQAGNSTRQITVTDSLPANDADLIEKAWVIKAKQIVEQTKNNPYEQSNEIKKIRGEYQNKRFNTKLKIDRD
jgi:hypothetical protein